MPPVRKDARFSAVVALAILTSLSSAYGYDWVWTHDAHGEATVELFDGRGLASDSDSTTSPSDEWMIYYARVPVEPGTHPTVHSIGGSSKVDISGPELGFWVSLSVFYVEDSALPFGCTGDGSLSTTFEFTMPLDQLGWKYDFGDFPDDPLWVSGTAVVENVTQGAELLSLSGSQIPVFTVLNGTAGDLIRVTVNFTGGGTVPGGDGIRDPAIVFNTEFYQPDCNENKVADDEDIASGFSDDCNTNDIPDECDTGEGTSPDCNFDTVPDECQPDEDCNTNTIRDICDIGAGTSPDCNNNLVPDECDDCNDNTFPDAEDIANETSTDCDLNCVPDDCEFADCNTNTFHDACDISEGRSFDLNQNGVPDECDPLAAPGLPALEVHQARKNRYISIYPGTNGANDVALKVTLASMIRCSGDERQSCIADSDCIGVCTGDLEMWCSTNAQCESAGAGTCLPTGPCAEHGDVGLSWWVQPPEQNPDGCIPACTDEDWYARVEPATKVFRWWTLDTLHIGDCEIVPVATYELRACLPPEGTICSAPLTIGTIHKPSGKHYGDVVGPVESGQFTPPDGIVNVTDPSAYRVIKESYGTTSNEPVAHPTWLDLTGPGGAPDYLMNAADLQQIEMAHREGYPYTRSVVNWHPGECNAACPNGRCDLGENSCNCAQDCGTPPTTESNCDDAIDNDCDIAIDCADDDCAADAACTAPRERVIEWAPVEPPGHGGNAVAVQAGSQVKLHLMVSGWDPNLDGDPRLGGFHARVDPAGYSSGAGSPLSPLGQPDMGFSGAFQAIGVCASDESNPEGAFDPLSVCRRDSDCPPAHPFCVERPDYVFDRIQNTPVTSTATLNFSWEAISVDCAIDPGQGEKRYAGTLILHAPAGATGTYTIGFNEDPDQTFFLDCDGAPIPGVTRRPAQITVCDEAVNPPTLPADPQHQAKKNRYLSFTPGNDCPYALAYEVSLTSMKRCSGDDRRACIVDGDCPGVCDNDNNLQCTDDGICGGGTCLPTDPCIEHSDVGSVVKYLDTPYVNSCIPLADCATQWFAQLTDSPVYRVWTENAVHILGCQIVPVAEYDVRATADGVSFSDPLTIGTIPKPQVHYGDCVGPVVAGAFTPADGFTNVTDVQAFLAAQGGAASAPHTTWVDLQSGSLPVVPQQILNVGDLQTIKAGFTGSTYVNTPGHEDPGDCP